MSLRCAENHDPEGGAHVKFRRADQVSHVFKENKVQVICAQLCQGLLCHGQVHMAAAAGMDLQNPGAGGGDGPGIHLSVRVRFDHTDPVPAPQRLNGPDQGRGLAGARRRHEVHKKNAFFPQSFSQQRRFPGFIFQNLCLYFQDRKLCLIHTAHRDPPLPSPPRSPVILFSYTTFFRDPPLLSPPRFP